MKKPELIGKIYDFLRDSGARKPVAIPRQTYTITDEAGNRRQFSIKRQDTMALYTMEDIKKIFDAILTVIIDSMQHGDNIYLPGIGTLSFNYRKATKCHMPGTKMWIDVPAHYVPRMQWSQAMKEAARLFEAYIKENTDIKEAVPIKRKRGRPPKNNLLASLTDQIEASRNPDNEIYDPDEDIDELIDEEEYDEIEEDEEALNDGA